MKEMVTKHPLRKKKVSTEKLAFMMIWCPSRVYNRRLAGKLAGGGSKEGSLDVIKNMVSHPLARFELLVIYLIGLIYQNSDYQTQYRLNFINMIYETHAWADTMTTLIFDKDYHLAGVSHDDNSCCENQTNLRIAPGPRAMHAPGQSRTCT